MPGGGGFGGTNLRLPTVGRLEAVAEQPVPIEGVGGKTFLSRNVQAREANKEVVQDQQLNRNCPESAEPSGEVESRPRALFRRSIKASPGR